MVIVSISHERGRARKLTTEHGRNHEEIRGEHLLVGFRGSVKLDDDAVVETDE